MPILISIGGSGSGIAIRSEHNFENIAARDTYFPTKKGELISNETYVWTKDTGKLYKWTGISNPEEYDMSLFKEVTPVVKGERGLPGETSYDAKTSETLKTPRKINGIEFDGSKDIFIPKSPDDVDKEYVDAELNKKANVSHIHTKTEVGLDNVDNTKDINKNVLSATKLTTARKINGIEFDGTKDITLPNGTGSATFLGLGDVPNSYFGEKGKVVRVKSDESGLEFVTNVGDVTKTYVDDELLKKANSTHSHSKSEITDFPKIAVVGLSGSYNDLLNKPIIDVDKLYVDTELVKKSNTSHKHVKSDITDFPTLSSVATSGSYNDLSNKPTIPTVDVTKSYVDGELNKKANSSHAHVISDVTELKTNLDSKADKTTTYTKTEVDNIASKKVDVVAGKQLSTEDYSSSDKNKVSKINTGGTGEKFLADNGVYKNIIGGVSSVNSKTGEVNINKNDVGLGNIDNTSDINKPVSTLTQTALNGKEDKSNKGLSNGYASLDANGKVPSSQLPSYVDDVIEVASFSSLPTTGETGKIYVTIDTNKCYRWGNTTYVPIVNGNVNSVNSKTGDVIIAKADIGLSNVDNTSDINKPISTATQNALNNKSNSTHKHTISDVIDLQTSLDAKSDKTTTYTKTEVDSSMSNKVDKVTGKSLILDTEINRLSTVTNYTHPTTHPATMISGLANVATSGSYNDLLNKPTIPTVDVTKAYVDGELNKKANTTHIHNISDVTNLQSTLDSKANASTVYTKTEVDSKDNLKVDKTITINSKPLNANVVLTKSDLGLSNVDNTSDLNKPISTATKEYIDNAPYIKLKSLPGGVHYSNVESGMYYLQQPSVSDGYPSDVRYAYMIVTDRYWMLIERDKGKRYYKYAQSNGNSSPWIEDVDKKYVDDALVSKVEKVSGKSLIADSEITRLSTVTNYTHPATHPSSMITGLSTVATSGKYSDLSGLPIIDVNKKYVDDALLGKADVKQYYGSTPYHMLPVGFFYVTNCTVENGYPPNVTSAWVTKTNGEFFLTDRATGKQYFRYNNNGGMYEPWTEVPTKKYIDDTIGSHVNNGSNPHNTTKFQVGLGNVDNTSDINKNVNSATKLTTPRTISLGGDATGSANFDGSTNISINSTLKNVGTAGVQKPKVTTDAQGRIISSSELTATDIPSLDHNKITDFDTQVKSIPLNKLGEPIGFMNMAGHRVTGVQLDPTSDSDVVTKYHFDKNILKVQLCAIYKHKPFGNSLYTEQAVAQAWYDKYKSKSGYKSPDTTNPLELCPELPPVQAGKMAIWLGDNVWYWRQGDGSNTTWSGMSAFNFKQHLPYAVEYIALGTPLRDGKLDVIYADDVINAHATNANNPHNTTKSQVGLGNVDNTSDKDKPASNATLNALALKQNINDNELKTSSKYVAGAINELYNHSVNGSNPHSTTKMQVGLGSVDNTSDASKNVLSATKLTTARKINGVDFDGSKDVSLSKSNFSDLNLVDNTSDINKPISTATQTALNDKQSKEDLNLRTKSKTIVGAINDLSERDSIQAFYPVYQMTPPLRYPASDGGNQAQIQEWYDKNKSKMGYISDDTPMPLGKHPNLPIVPVGVTAVWLGDTTWYTKAGDGTRNCWIYMTSTRKCDFQGKICIALGSTFNEAKASVADMNSKVDIVQGKSLISDGELSRLAKLTNYTHPTTHPASMITGLSPVATSGSYYSLTGLPTLSMVAISGAFGDLLNKPGNATFNHDGFMSGQDKAKLDNLPSAYLYATLNSSFNPTTGQIGFPKTIVNYNNLINSGDNIHFSLPSKGIFEITARLGLDSNTTAISYRIYNGDTPVGMLGEAVDMKGYGCVFSEAFHVVDMSKETTNKFNVRVTWDSADVLTIDNSFLKIVQVR